MSELFKRLPGRWSPFDDISVGWANKGIWSVHNRYLGESLRGPFRDRASAWAGVLAATGSPFEHPGFKRAYDALKLLAFGSGITTADFARKRYGKPGRRLKRDTPGVHARRYLGMLAARGLCESYFWKGGCKKWKPTPRGRQVIEIGDRWLASRSQSKIPTMAA